MIGLKRGTVLLQSYNSEWKTIAENTINLLWKLLGNTALDIQHIGSTAIPGIHAKPIIDIIVGVDETEDVLAYNKILSSNGIVFHREAIKGQLLFIIGDLENEIITHHIHIVKYKSIQWTNYINFRDYLTAFPQKAAMYDNLKTESAEKFSDNRKLYTESKEKLIDVLIKEADSWKRKNMH